MKQLVGGASGRRRELNIDVAGDARTNGANESKAFMFLHATGLTDASVEKSKN